MNANKIGSSIPVRNATNAVEAKKIPTSFLFSCGAANVNPIAIPTYPPMYSGKNPAWKIPDPRTPAWNALISPNTTVFSAAVNSVRSPIALSSGPEIGNWNHRNVLIM